MIAVNAPLIQQAACVADMTGCWAAMVAFDTKIDCELDGAFVEDSLLSWVSRNSSKPQRSAEQTKDTWVLHATPEWT